MVVSILKQKIRRLLKCRSNETITDCLDRKKYYTLRKIYTKKYTINDLETKINNIGICEGDNIFVQSSWRTFIGFEGEPIDVILLLKRKVTSLGTILMPSKGDSIYNLNINEDKSTMGVISEEFRKDESTIRSKDSYFPINCWGDKNYELIKDHEFSNNPFDDKSPLGILSKKGGKLIFLGMGKNPHKVSFIHNFTFNKIEDKFYKDIFTKTIYENIIDNDLNINKKALIRRDGIKNHKKNMKKAIRLTDKKVEKIGLVYIVCIDIKELNKTLGDMHNKGIKFYKVR